MVDRYIVPLQNGIFLEFLDFNAGVIMSKIERLFLFLLAGVVIVSEVHKSLADTGPYNATRVEVGNTFQTRVIVLPASAATQIVLNQLNRPDETCFNNSGKVIWISSGVGGTTAIGMGFPILSSSAFRLQSMSSTVYATPDSGVGEVRCGDGMTL